MNSVISEGLTFKEIERTFFEMGCETARNLMSEFLFAVDKEICETRNKAELRHKGSCETTVKTLMGEVPVKRALYRRVLDDGKIEHVFLLDEELGLDTIGNISPNLVEKIAGHICEMSFREVANAVSGLTNQSISHQGICNVVQTIGEIADEKLEPVYEAVASGVGLAGCHAGLCDDFRDKLKWQHMTGGKCLNHPGSIVTYTVNIKRGPNQIMEGIKDFEITSEQYYLLVDRRYSYLLQHNVCLRVVIMHQMV